MDLASVIIRLTALLPTAVLPAAAAASPDPARRVADDPATGSVVRFRYAADWNAPDADDVRRERGEVLVLFRERLVLLRRDDFPETVWMASADDAGDEWTAWMFQVAGGAPKRPEPVLPAAIRTPPPPEPARLRDVCIRPPADGPSVDASDSADREEQRLTPGPVAAPGEAWIREIEGGRELRIRRPDGGRWVVRLEL